MKDAFGPAAMICAVIANCHRDADQKPEPWKPADFLPGARTEEDEMREFVERVQRGDKFEVDPEAVAEFRRQMTNTFKNVKVGEVTNVGPSGKIEPVRVEALK